MAGSYNHIINDDGTLTTVEAVNDMLENGGDVYECVEQMYGMIWYLAECLDSLLPHQGPGTLRELVDDAEENYREGLRASRS